VLKVTAYIDKCGRILRIVLQTRVARWYIFKPEIPIWVNFGGSCNGRCWCTLCLFGLCILRPFSVGRIWTFGKFCGPLVHIFFPFCYVVPQKSGNLAPDMSFVIDCFIASLARNYIHTSPLRHIQFRLNDSQQHSGTLL
jgi:hypothetical protein